MCILIAQVISNAPEFALESSLELLVQPHTSVDHKTQPKECTEDLNTCEEMPVNSKELGLAKRMVLMQSGAHPPQGAGEHLSETYSTGPGLLNMERPPSPPEWRAPGENISVINVFLSRYTSKGPRQSNSSGSQRGIEACQQFPSGQYSGVHTIINSQNANSHSSTFGELKEQSDSICQFTSANQQNMLQDQGTSDKTSTFPEDSKNAYFVRELSRAESPSVLSTISHAQDTDQHLAHNNSINDATSTSDKKSHEMYISAQIDGCEKHSFVRNNGRCVSVSSNEGHHNRDSRSYEKICAQNKSNHTEQEYVDAQPYLLSNLHCNSLGWSGKGTTVLPAPDQELKRLNIDSPGADKIGEAACGANLVGNSLDKTTEFSISEVDCKVPDELHEPVHIANRHMGNFPRSNKSCGGDKGRFSPTELQEALHAEMER